MVKRCPVVVLVVAFQACVTVRTEPPRPSPVHATLDLGPLLEQQTQNGTVVLDREPSLMRRVLLGPNLVFESSRSSALESPVSGSEGDRELSLKNAIGIPVRIVYSSMLLRAMAERSSALVVPAISKRWERLFCTEKDKDCQGTWVERLMLAVAESLRRQDNDKNGAPAELPTSAMAVRMLGLATIPIAVVVNENPKTGFVEVRQRATASQPSMCGQDMQIPVPSIGFQAELVSLKDARLLSRINDVRPVQVSPSWVQQQIDMTAVSPVLEPGRPGKAPFVAEWRQDAQTCRAGADGKTICVAVVCDSIHAAVSRLLEELKVNERKYAWETMKEILKNNLDPLY